MNYQEFLIHIYERYSGNVKLGLERMHSILEEMGNPEKQLKGIHIAGTNGKGSVSAISEALALSQSLTTGMNTSPHLIDYCERFRINGENIHFEEIMKIHEEYQAIFDKNDASFFEITTSIAFALLVKQQIDTAIIEVGLGGRLDGTQPFCSTVCVITTISLDHPKSLGSSIEQIAFEKAGIIKHKTPVVLGNIVPECQKVILEVARDKDAPVSIYNQHYYAKNIRISEEGTIFDYSFPEKGIELKDLRVNLLGEHQAINASTALTSFIIYQEILGRSINYNSIREGLGKVNWFGRMQILANHPLVLIDGAHNEEGVHTLISNLKKMFPNRFIRFVVAILRDKKLDKMIMEICQYTNEIYISKNHSERAADLEEQMEVARQFNIPSFAVNDVIEACTMAYKETKPDEILVITGSLYTIAEVLNKKNELFKK